MSSPSPRGSPASAAAAGPRALGSESPSRPSVGRRDVASTPGRDGEDDARMVSPSPARQGQASPLKARIGEFVDEGRTKLQGLLFGPRASTPRAEGAAPAREQVEGPEAGAAQDEGEEHADEDDDEDQPFPQPQAKQRPRAPASLADSTLTSHSHSRSHASFDSSTTSTSRRHPRRRRRPSHPTLPVIEITSTDARAAARAAAILKVHHKYVEQGISAVDAARAAADAFDKAQREGEEDEDSEEEELRTLLLDAVDELREQAPAQARTRTRTRSVSVSVTTSTSTAAAGGRWTPAEWRRLEQTLVELGRRLRRDTSVASSCVGGRSMRSESIAMANVVGDEVEPEAVVEAFLRSMGVAREECVGEWNWDKLLFRVEALKMRRADDVRKRRALSHASTSHVGSRAGQASLPPLHERGETERSQSSAVVDEHDEHDATREAHATVVKQEQLSDDEQWPFGPAGDSESENSDNEQDRLGDDTFFASSKRDRRRSRRASIEPVYVPTALANPALRHLYDDFQLEKPKLPLKEVLREDSPESSGPASGEDEAPRESTPGADDRAGVEPPRSPSSAQRLISYLGSFVRRSPAPSPASSTRALPADSSASPSPSPVPEMQQVQFSASRVTPQFASTAKPYPPLPAATTHKPLPPIEGRVVRPLPHSASQPQHRADASTSRFTLEGDTTSEAVDLSGSSGGNSSTSSVSLSTRRRRRSSGEGSGRVWAAVDAIEEAESSREEEESRVIELLRGGSAAKRRAASGDLRERTDAAEGKGKGKAREVDWRGFVEIEQELGRTMVPTGTRALDRRVSGERRVSRR
ncbi:hypothetical protein DMC30DRAFT_389305 [Rhodotorula diobovata]|uniref:Proteophosphoglycan ppg4 n=1 Tax=Rhodotorula diobovata TaxID=5288 RepID=A0A5C5G318_9BASI|nr:hypothetical protein DMC30DRAFT_389305 [Rhodotorula diobovata]